MPNPETDIVQSRIGVPGPNGGTVTAGDFADVLNRLAVLEGRGGPQRGIVSAYYYGPRTTISGGTNTNLGINANYLNMVPFNCPVDATFNQIAVSVSTAAAASGAIRFAVYRSGADGLPSTLLADLGSVDVTATGHRPSPPISLTLSRGLYWIAGVPNMAVSIRHIAGDSMTNVIGNGSSDGSSPESALLLSIAANFSTFPATFTTSNASPSLYVPIFSLRAA